MVENISTEVGHWGLAIEEKGYFEEVTHAVSLPGALEIWLVCSLITHGVTTVRERANFYTGATGAQVETPAPTMVMPVLAM